ncbi:MAG: hypothetical protein ACFFD4_04775 [Candidatus Odinarchaeota archaeon]
MDISTGFQQFCLSTVKRQVFKTSVYRDVFSRKNQVLIKMEMPKIEFRFARSGIIMVAIFLVIGYLLQVIRFNFFGLFEKPEDFIIFPVASLLIAAAIIALWFVIGQRYGPKIGYYLVENKILALIFVKGNKYYFEKVSEEAHKVSGPLILSRFIALFISWISISSSLVAIFGTSPLGGWLYTGARFDSSDPIVNFLGDAGIIGILLKFLLIMVMAPLILTLIIPITWLLVDVRLKALHTGSMTNWYVGHKVQARLNSFVSIGALIALGGSVVISSISDIFNKLVTIISLVFYCIFYISFPIIVIITIYSLLFHTTFYEKFLDAIPAPYGETKVEFFVKEGKYEGKKVEIEKKEPEPEPEPEPEQTIEDNDTPSGNDE